MTPELRAHVITRDRLRCVRCRTALRAHDSVSVHHRRLRSQGGVDCACNLLLLCGSGTTGCHGWVHAHPREARALGLLVSAYVDPRAVALDGTLLDCSTSHA